MQAHPPDEPRIPLPPRPLRGVAVVIPRGSRLLVIRRSALVRAPRMYCFPGGGLEAGESEAEAVVREVREELRVEVQPIRPLWSSVTPWSVELSWWLAELPDGHEPAANPQEVESVHWLELSEIRQLPQLLASNHHFLDACDRGEIR
ncbi:MAG: NUDIX hydrolase, partial [Pirellulaceae bacterium]